MGEAPVGTSGVTMCDWVLILEQYLQLGSVLTVRCWLVAASERKAASLVHYLRLVVVHGTTTLRLKR